MSKVIFKLVLSVLFLFSSVVSIAQKIPNVQQISLRAPANIKIDGKTTEWGNKFQAYNHATDIFYTISNDDENIYLMIHAIDPDVLTKITNSGIVFRINTSGKKSDENVVSVTYPIFDVRYGNKPYIMFDNMAQPHAQREASERNPDSLSKVANTKLHDNEKYILIKGMPGIDTLLSVFNRDGIRAKEAFDSTMAYTYELAVPLKYINFKTEGASSKFFYHILLPGLDISKEFGFKTTTDANGSFHISVASSAIPRKEHFNALSSTTDFWGEYTLAPK